jgi:hypothetical protein
VKRYRIRARLLAAVLAIAPGSTVVATPAIAAEPAPRPLAAAAAAAGAALPAAAAVQAAPAAPVIAAPTAAESKPFFKSAKGKVALVFTAAVLGYMAYSMSHDRVKSPGR